MIEKKPMTVRSGTSARSKMPSAKEIGILRELEQKIRWLASWTIHNANHLRPSRAALKVGGHQASSASMSTIMTALYLNVLRPEDRVAVKPHASPNFHAIQYLLGKQTRQQLENFRALGGAQAYPSRTKDSDDVDFSTGSVGLGVGATLFSAVVQDYAVHHKLTDSGYKKGRMIALMGDAELDEGSVYEALLEGWKKDVRNLWWIIDYNRQSLDGVINDYLYKRIMDFFKSVGWNVITLKHGKQQQKAFKGPAGKALHGWIDNCSNQLYCALTFKGGAAWRKRLSEDLKGAEGLEQFLANYDDHALQNLMTNLGGHDMEAILEAFRGVDSDIPHCFVAYTIKGYGLPLAGHKDNHAGMMTPDQMAQFQRENGVETGQEWDRSAGLSTPEKELSAFLKAVPFNRRPLANVRGPVIPVGDISAHGDVTTSTQVAFGKIMNDLADRQDDLSGRIVTTSPDVAASTNLGAWINKRGVYLSDVKGDVFRDEQVPSALKWSQTPDGQHIELGIAENNLFTLLASLGMAEQHFGARLLPVGTLYDAFIGRGLDALNYACYQDARFMVVGTPSGITLAPEGGAHQSINTQLIGMAQDRLVSYEPAYADELAVLMQWSLEFMQQEDGSSVYMRLSTRAVEQPRRELSQRMRRDIIKGGYWIKEPAAQGTLAIVYTGVVAPEAKAAFEKLAGDMPGVGLLAVTSADRLYADWQNAKEARYQGEPESASHIESLLAPLAHNAGIVTVCDGSPVTLTWLGAVLGHRVEGLGVRKFGQSGNLNDLYDYYGISIDAILDACAAACLNTIYR
jgi:pyruvate dehydrogenase E1 component